MKKSGHSQDLQVAPIWLQAWPSEAGWHSEVESDPTWEAKRPVYSQLRKPGEEEYIMAEPLQSSWPPMAVYHNPSYLQEEEVHFNKEQEEEETLFIKGQEDKVLFKREQVIGDPAYVNAA